MAELADIISYQTLGQLAHRNQAEVARRGCRGVSALYYPDSLPYRYQVEVYRRYPDLQAQVKAKRFVDRVVPDCGAVAFYEDYEFADGSHLPADKVEEYANNASVLNAFRDWLEGSASEHKRTSHAMTTKGEFWANAAASLDRIDSCPNTLPRNPRRLQERYNQYRRDGYAALISVKYGNSNAAKVHAGKQEDLIVALCSQGNGYDNEYVAHGYNKVAGIIGWKPISASTVANVKTRNQQVIAQERYGRNRYASTRAMQVRRARPTGAMLMWSLDGWDAELYYRKRNAKGVTTYTNRKVLEVVIDASCSYPVGYAIGDREDSSLIATALRDASNHTKGLLGARYKACQIQSDHFAMSAMAPYYATMGAKVTPARVGNAKSKPIERYFAHLNDDLCKVYPNWSGHGITASKDGQPSSEWLNANKRGFPDEEGVVRQIEEVMARERAAKVGEFMAAWERTAPDNRLPLSEEAYLLRFGRTTGYRNVLEGAGLRPRIEGRKMAYDCFDPTFRDFAHLRWEVRYDPADLSHALAVSEDGTRRYLLEEKYVQPMALADRKEGDDAELHRVFEHNDRLYERNERRYAEVMGNVRSLSGNGCLDVLDGAGRNLLATRGAGGCGELEDADAHCELAKALVTDSRGQHKSERSDERRRLAECVQGEETAAKKRRKRHGVDVETVHDTPAEEGRINTFDLY